MCVARCPMVHVTPETVTDQPHPGAAPPCMRFRDRFGGFAGIQRPPELFMLIAPNSRRKLRGAEFAKNSDGSSESDGVSQQFAPAVTMVRVLPSACCEMPPFHVEKRQHDAIYVVVFP